jgi:uncharacterized protein (DUF2235 family)
MVGLLPSDQLNIANYGLRAYKQASEADDFTIAWHFAKVANCRPAKVHFVGVWDTVASVLVPGRERVLPRLQTLPYTRANPSVAIFRHAMAIDERRRMFRLNRWTEPQPFVHNRFSKAPPPAQNIKQVWFAGVHADIGGGYAETESGLAKISLDWMIAEAAGHGLKVNTAMRNHIVLGHPRTGARSIFVKPNATAEQHNSMTWGWRLLEWIPKPAQWRDWHRPTIAGLYVPWAEPRLIAAGQAIPVIHQSELERMAQTTYRPVNFPARYNVEPWSG